ncbi:heme lyase CcmF/NrfE family subunit [Pseudoxanthobacter sp.]|uniref:heme lyase CcmF/NrfE family subunit n=1 Tax=Pseudoxanthobacter sp. TaxID=1925742 RepID=UPI002FE3B09A
MIAEAGHFALVLALALALVQSVVPVWGARTGNDRVMAMAPVIAGVLFVLVALAFAALVSAYVRSDFSLLNVVQNSHSEKPLLFRITGVWGNHEGSMLLWVLILTLFGALVAAGGRDLPADMKALALAAQGWISAAFLAFILATSDPFVRIDPAPMEGQDLNPVLQDIGLAVHPPLLYLGYVGLSVAFSFAVAALLGGRVDAAWARRLRPWVLMAWSFLTLGIAMGSYWAYYELGWGGWWFWDPVENASFMPWLAATALLHSAAVMEKRAALKVWTVLLAILAFSLSLLGTFLVRSGVLTSVHAFATDPGRGLFILAILAGFIGGSLTLFAWRAPQLAPGGLFAPISREGALVFNNLILTTACATVLVGTLYPLALDVLAGTKITVGAPFFNLTFVPLMVPALLAVPFGPFLSWKRADLAAVAERLIVVAAIALAAVAVTLWWSGGSGILAALALGLGIWLVAGAVAEPVWRVTRGGGGAGAALRRLAGLPLSAWGTAFGHLGLGLTVIGIAAATAFQSEKIVLMKPGDSLGLAGYTLVYEGAQAARAPTYTVSTARFALMKDGARLATLRPEKRFYTVRQMPTTESAITTRGLSQVYVSLGDPGPEGAFAVHAFYKPLVTLIWLGAVVMAFGGVCSLADRRLRIGVPRAASARRRAPGEAAG